jgi:hypothetical protein
MVKKVNADQPLCSGDRIVVIKSFIVLHHRNASSASINKAERLHVCFHPTDSTLATDATGLDGRTARHLADLRLMSDVDRNRTKSKTSSALSVYKSTVSMWNATSRPSLSTCRSVWLQKRSLSTCEMKLNNYARLRRQVERLHSTFRRVVDNADGLRLLV